MPRYLLLRAQAKSVGLKITHELKLNKRAKALFETTYIWRFANPIRIIDFEFSARLLVLI
jgi:hypothetical protein